MSTKSQFRQNCQIVIQHLSTLIEPWEDDETDAHFIAQGAVTCGIVGPTSAVKVYHDSKVIIVSDRRSKSFAVMLGPDLMEGGEMPVLQVGVQGRKIRMRREYTLVVEHVQKLVDKIRSEKRIQDTIEEMNLGKGGRRISWVG